MAIRPDPAIAQTGPFVLEYSIDFSAATRTDQPIGRGVDVRHVRGRCDWRPSSCGSPGPPPERVWSVQGETAASAERAGTPPRSGADGSVQVCLPRLHRCLRHPVGVGRRDRLSRSGRNTGRNGTADPRRPFPAARCARLTRNEGPAPAQPCPVRTTSCRTARGDEQEGAGRRGVNTTRTPRRPPRGKVGAGGHDSAGIGQRLVRCCGCRVLGACGGRQCAPAALPRPRRT